MASTSFGDRLAHAVQRTQLPLCVGFDPHLDRLPVDLRAGFSGLRGARFRDKAAHAVLAWQDAVLDGLADRVPAIKPQLAFYEQLGAAGFAALEALCAGAQARGLLVVADGKRGDISSTAAAYAQALLHPEGPVAADALTVNPWLGEDTLQPFLGVCAAHGRGLFVLVRTTNPGSAQLQRRGQPANLSVVCDMVRRANAGLVGQSGTGPVGVVVGAQAAAEAPQIRAQVPAAWFLVPGLGAQGGGAADSLAGARPDGLGALPSSSRGVLFPAKGDKELLEDVAQGVSARLDATASGLQAAWRV